MQYCSYVQHSYVYEGTFSRYNPVYLADGELRSAMYLRGHPAPSTSQNFIHSSVCFYSIKTNSWINKKKTQIKNVLGSCTTLLRGGCPHYALRKADKRDFPVCCNFDPTPCIVAGEHHNPYLRSSVLETALQKARNCSTFGTSNVPLPLKFPFKVQIYSTYLKIY